MNTYGKMVANHKYDPVGFTAVNGLKDINLILDAAHGKVHMPVAELVQKRMQALVADGNGDNKDWASIAKDVKLL